MVAMVPSAVESAAPEREPDPDSTTAGRARPHAGTGAAVVRPHPGTGYAVVRAGGRSAPANQLRVSRVHGHRLPKMLLLDGGRQPLRRSLLRNV